MRGAEFLGVLLVGLLSACTASLTSGGPDGASGDRGATVVDAGDGSISPGGDVTSNNPDTNTGTIDTTTDSAASPDIKVDPNDPFARARQLCVDLSNEKRALVSSGPLTRWVEKEPCVDGEAKVESDANAAGEPAHSSRGTCGELAQNLCGGMGWGIEELTRYCVEGWFNEGPGEGWEHAHYYQLINPAFTKVACGFYLSSTGDLQIVQTLY
ncbi:MAG: hypothetical protein JRH20_06085 [Deltaproteobacteria bacterium]|nr:hypothetical protein [Deltaproteobacteria bacterium]